MNAKKNGNNTSINATNYENLSAINNNSMYLLLNDDTRNNSQKPVVSSTLLQVDQPVQLEQNHPNNIEFANIYDDTAQFNIQPTSQTATSTQISFTNKNNNNEMNNQAYVDDGNNLKDLESNGVMKKKNSKNIIFIDKSKKLSIVF
jgi:hypothetical protein